jgi:hypothetical protein
MTYSGPHVGTFLYRALRVDRGYSGHRWCRFSRLRLTRFLDFRYGFTRLQIGAESVGANPVEPGISLETRRQKSGVN